MKLKSAIYLGFVLCCPALYAQQMLASLPLQPAKIFGAPEVSAATLSGDLARPASGLALPSEASIYQAVVPPLTPAVCAQATDRLPPSEYAFNRSRFTSAAFKAVFQHANLVKMVQNFVPGRPLPDAPYYQPLTSQQKFDQFLQHTRSPGTALGVLSDSLISQATGAYPRFGGGMEGYGKRLGASAAGAGAAAFFGQYLFPTLLHQDPRYFPSHQDSIANRLAYAASRTLIGRSDSGHSVVNTSVIASQFVEAGLANAYIPYRNESVSGTVQNALLGVGAVAEANIINEFWPDIKRFVLKHTKNPLVRRSMEAADTSNIAAQ